MLLNAKHTFTTSFFLHSCNKILSLVIDAHIRTKILANSQLFLTSCRSIAKTYEHTNIERLT